MTEKINDKSIWDEIYRKTENKPGWDLPGLDYNLLELIEKHSDPKGDIRLLDSGCGNGRNAPLVDKLKEATGRNVRYCGIDFAPSAVDYCRKQYPAGKFYKQDMCIDLTGAEIEKEAPFDVIMDCGCFHAIPPEKRASYIQNVTELCAHDGIVVIGAWYRVKEKEGEEPQYYPFLYLSEWFFSEEDIQNLWKETFTLLDWRVDRYIYPEMFDGFGYFVLKKK